jgi:hypothetical protein
MLVQHVCFEPHAGHGHDAHEGEVKYCLHVLDTQMASGPQGVAHAPQYCESVVRSTQPS